MANNKRKEETPEKILDVEQPRWRQSSKEAGR